MAREEDEEIEEDDDLPQKRNRNRDDDDPPQKRKKKKKPKRPTPGLLLAMSITALLSGGSCLLFSCASIVRAGYLVSQVNPVGNGFLITAVIMWTLFSLMAASVLAGGVALIMRKAIGRMLVLGGTFGMFCFLAILLVLGLYQKGRFDISDFILMFVTLIVFGLCVFYFRAQQDDNVNRVLK